MNFGQLSVFITLFMKGVSNSLAPVQEIDIAARPFRDKKCFIVNCSSISVFFEPFNADIILYWFVHITLTNTCYGVFFFQVSRFV